jgi:hypothetical protein
MFKRDYFINSMKLGLYLYKRWVLEAFSITRPSGPHEYPFGLTILPDGRYAVLDPDHPDGHRIIEDAFPGEPLFSPLEKVILKVGDIDNVRENVATCYGNALVNQMVLVYAYGDKIAYISGPIKIGSIEKEIQDRWNDELDDTGLPPEQKPLRTHEYHKFNEAVGQLPGLSQLCVPSATRKTMTADPAMLKRRDELLIKHKDRLHDPVVLAEILDELTKMDRAWMKGDPGERFYIKDKSYDVIRLKVFIMQGISTGFGEAGDLITASLDEGWDITKLPAMINQLRAGSYSRGAQTALAGVETKFNNRIFQNSAITEQDCGTNRGLRVLMRAYKAPFYQGNYQIVDGVPTLLTEENLKPLSGKIITVRSALYCKTAGANFCATCIGDRIATTPDALGSYASDIGSIFLSLFMAAMHGKSLKTEELDYDHWLT